jgi:hypothetical protein
MDPVNSRPPSPNPSHPQPNQQNELKTDLSKELTIAAGAVGFNLAGLALGTDFMNMVAAPSTIDEAERLFRATCEVFNGTLPLNNKLLCNVTDLEAVEALFPDIAKVSLISGSSFMLAAIVLVFGYIFYRHHTDDQEQGALSSPARSFVRRTVNTFVNMLFLIASLPLSGAFSYYMGETPSLPPTQQLLNGICEGFFPEGSNSTLLCDMDLLKLVATLFVQPRGIMLWSGGAIIVGIFLFVLIYALCRSLSPQGTEETDEGTPLHSSNNKLPVESDHIDNLEAVVVEN